MEEKHRKIFCLNYDYYSKICDSLTGPPRCPYPGNPGRTHKEPFVKWLTLSNSVNKNSFPSQHHTVFCSPYPGSPWEGLNVTTTSPFNTPTTNNDINGPERGRKRKRNTTPIIVRRGPRGFGHHLVMGWTGAVPQGFQSAHQHPKRPDHCMLWSERLWLCNPRHPSLLRDTAFYTAHHLVMGVDGGGPNLGAGL